MSDNDGINLAGVHKSILPSFAEHYCFIPMGGKNVIKNPGPS